MSKLKVPRDEVSGSLEPKPPTRISGTFKVVKVKPDGTLCFVHMETEKYYELTPNDPEEFKEANLNIGDYFEGVITPSTIH